MIDVQWVEVSRKTREQDDIRLRYGPSWALPLVTDDEIVE